MHQFVTIFLALMVETTPFLLAGVILAVVGGPWLQRAVVSFGSNSPLVGIAAGATAGLAVQLAARICDRAEPGQVLVSRVVADLCAGKKLQFSHHSDATLKGFAEPVALYEVGAESTVTEES